MARTSGTSRLAQGIAHRNVISTLRLRGDNSRRNSLVMAYSTSVGTPFETTSSMMGSRLIMVGSFEGVNAQHVHAPLILPVACANRVRLLPLPVPCFFLSNQSR